MKDKITSALGLTSFITVGFYLVNIFYSMRWLEITYSVLAAILLFCAIFIVRRSNQVIIILLLVSGFYFFISENSDLVTMIYGFGENINLLSIFILVPLLAIYISIAGYTEALKQKIIEMEQNSNSKPYRLSFLLTLTMGLVLNLGSMSIIYNIAKRSFSNYYQKKLVLMILRAFGFCMFCSPYFVNIGLVLALYHVSWLDVGVFGFLIGLIYIIVNIIFFPFIQFNDDQFVKREKEISVEGKAKLYPLYLFGGILLALSLILDFLLEVSMLTIVSVLGFAYPLIWSLLTKRGKQYFKQLMIYVKTSFQRLKNEIVVFVSAGFFGAAISETDIGIEISKIIFTYSFDSMLIMSYIVILFAIFLSLLGIHPVVIITGIGSALSPQFFGVSGSFMALLLIVAWTLATQLSPFSGSILMASSLANHSPWEFSKQNLLFVVVLTIILPLLLYSFYVLGFI